MQRLQQLGLLFILLFSFSAFAEENSETKNKFMLLPKDVYFQPGGGLRIRYENLREATGKAFSSEEDDSNVTSRAQFDFKMYKGEFFETFFRFLHVSTWGNGVGDTNAGQKDGFNSNNGLLVNQAWALWKVDDSLGLKFGRSPIVNGRGLTYGANDWFNVPYSFDHFDVIWDWESVELSIIAAKALELQTVANQTLSPDPEENHIIVDLDIKNMSDSIRVFNFLFAQINRDLGSTDGTAANLLNGLNMQRLAMDVDIKARQFELGLFLSYVTGEERVADANKPDPADPEKKEIQQVAGDLKIGYLLPESNNLHFWGRYHYDSGSSNETNKHSKDYDPFYYEVYGNSGIMDFIRWGNLTYYSIGMDVDLTPRWTLGGEWLEFSKTDSNRPVNFGPAGRFMDNKISTGDITLGSAKDLGNEMDIWLDYTPGSGVEVRATLAAFLPGEAFNSATTTSNIKPTSTIYQALVQVGFFF